MSRIVFGKVALCLASVVGALEAYRGAGSAVKDALESEGVFVKIKPGPYRMSLMETAVNATMEEIVFRAPLVVVSPTTLSAVGHFIAAIPLIVLSLIRLSVLAKSDDGTITKVDGVEMAFHGLNVFTMMCLYRFKYLMLAISSLSFGAMHRPVDSNELILLFHTFYQGSMGLIFGIIAMRLGFVYAAFSHILTNVYLGVVHIMPHHPVDNFVRLIERSVYNEKYLSKCITDHAIATYGDYIVDYTSGFYQPIDMH